MRRGVFLFLFLVLAACGGAQEAPPSSLAGAGISSPAAARGAPVVYAYPSLDQRDVSSEANVGAPSVIAFITTDDLASQAEVDFLVTMAKNDADRVHYALVALQDPKEKELVELYASKLGVTFPVAVAGKDIAAAAPFGEVLGVPTVVVLDKRGAIAWKSGGLAKPPAIRAALKGL